MMTLIRKKQVWVPILVGLIVLSVFLLANAGTAVWALSIRDVEFTFHILDQKNRKPISNASLKITDESAHDDTNKLENLSLTTDSQGMARFLRKNLFVDELIRPFRRTVAEVNTTWCVFSISADGYHSKEAQWLAEYRYENKGFDEKATCHKVIFTIALTPK